MIKRIWALLLVSAALLSAETFPLVSRAAYYSANMPATLTTVVTGDAIIDGVYLSTGSTGGSYTIQDISTDCNSGVCKWFDTVPLAANTTYVIPIPQRGVPMSGGIKIQASGSNLISVKIIYRY